MTSKSVAPRAVTNTHVGRLATVALVAIAYFITVIVALHVLRSDLDPISLTTSHYAVGDYGILMTSAYFGVSLASFALLIGLYRSLSPPYRSSAGLALLGVWAVGLLTIMFFPIDPQGEPRTTPGTIHRIVGPLSFLALCAGAILVSRSFKRDEKWRPFHRLSLTLSLAALAAFIVTFVNIATEAGYAGLSQRIVLVLFATWFVLTAVRLRSVYHPGEASPGLPTSDEIPATEAHPTECHSGE